MLSEEEKKMLDQYTELEKTNEEKKGNLKIRSNSIILKKERINPIEKLGLKIRIFKKNIYEDLKDPILEIIRRDGRIETIENAKVGKYKIKHSDGTNRIINLRPSKLLFREDKENERSIKVWVYYEDEIEAYPSEPLEECETINGFVDKVKSATKEFEQVEYKGKNEMIWTIAKSIGLVFAIIIGLLIVAQWFAPDLLNTIFKKGIETTGNVIENANGGYTNPQIFN